MQQPTQFVPQHPDRQRGKGSRARIIAACDNCRRRKIRCVRPNPDGSCNSCTASNAQCSFEDRGEYYGRVLHELLPQPSVPAGLPAPAERPPSRLVSSAGSATRTPTPAAGSRTSARISPPAASSRCRTPVPVPSPSFVQQQSVPVPPAEIMPALIQSFAHHCAEDTPFLDHSTLLSRYRAGQLSALLANCIAAHAIPYNDIPSLMGQDLYMMAQTYLYYAKTIIENRLRMFECSPSLVNQLILVAWMEYKSSRSAEFFAYTQVATEMADELGFSDPNTLVCMTRDPMELHRLQCTWSHVLRLQQTAAALRGGQ